METEIDLTEAHVFLDKLSGQNNASVTFQTFPDSELAEGKLTRILHGRLERWEKELVALNKQGAGIFFCVNETDGKGRKKENVVALRSAFADSDSGPVEDLPLAPSAIVESKRGPQIYYFLRAGGRLSDFSNVQTAIAAKLLTDPRVKDLPRVMRVPGFYHLKNPASPFLIRLKELNGQRYSVEDLFQVFPATKPQSGTVARSGPYSATPSLAAFRNWVRTKPTTQGSRDNTVVAICREGLARDIDIAVIESILWEYCAASNGPGIEPFPHSRAAEILLKQAKEHFRRPFTPNFPRKNK